MTSAPDLIALEPHGERRRQQLIRAASLVIENDGLDAMRMPRVAEVAGCARSLVYHYFPKREDLFVAVIEDFYECLGARLDPDEQEAGMRSLADRDAANPLLEALWDTVMEVGAGGLVLRSSPRIGIALNERLADLTARFDVRWAGPLGEIGLSEIEAAVVFRTAMAIHTELLERFRREELTREESLGLGQRALASLVSGLLNESEGE